MPRHNKKKKGNSGKMMAEKDMPMKNGKMETFTMMDCMGKEMKCRKGGGVMGDGM